MKVSHKLKESMYPTMKDEYITVNNPADLQALKTGGEIKSVSNDYPLIDNKGNIRSFPISIATEILKSSEAVRKAKAAREFDTNEPTASVSNARFGMDGWRELAESEFKQFKDGGVSNLELAPVGGTLAEFESEVENRVANALSAKDQEIENLKKQLAEANKPKGKESVGGLTEEEKRKNPHHPLNQEGGK